MERRAKLEKEKEKAAHEHQVGNRNIKVERTSAELLEPLVEAMMSMSSEAVAQLLGLLMFWILRLFVRETHITCLFDLADRTIDFYIIFVVLMVAATRVTDVLQLNLLEAVSGWKVFDFLKYMQFRF